MECSNNQIDELFIECHIQQRSTGEPDVEKGLFAEYFLSEKASLPDLEALDKRQHPWDSMHSFYAMCVGRHSAKMITLPSDVTETLDKESTSGPPCAVSMSSV